VPQLPVGQSGVFDPHVLRKLYPAHPAAVVLLQQQRTTFSRYQHTTLRVLIQDLKYRQHAHETRRTRRFYSYVREIE
jgi:hypothetical protein